MKKNAAVPTNFTKIHGWFDYESIYDEVFAGFENNAHIVEVGVWLGRSACYMAELIKTSENNIRFDCIDTWRISDKEKFQHLLTSNKKSQVVDFVNNMVGADVIEFVNVIQLSSLEAVNIYPDKSLDFVFLDNDHSEEHVFAELNAWWPKMKKNGILAGHDYIETDWPGVVSAVNRFGKKRRKSPEIRLHSFIFKK